MKSRLFLTARGSGGALDLVLAADERVDEPFDRFLPEIHAKRGERIFGSALALLFFAPDRGASPAFALLAPLVADLADAVGDVIDYIEALDPRFLQRVGGDGVCFGEDGDKDVAPFDLVLAGRADVDCRALDDTLKADRGARGDVDGFADVGHLVIEEMVELTADGVDIAAGVSDDARAVVVEEQCEQEMLDAHELVTPPFRLARGKPERDLDFGTDSHGHALTPARLSL